IKGDHALNMLYNCPSLQTINLSKEFFKGNMEDSNTEGMETTWVQLSNLSNKKSWKEMLKNWKLHDEGWWTCTSSDAAFNLLG
ncbi:MAG: hypothetical protein HUJ54_12360, partial [Erysipelotrichaceae bacterium]|nr:hypothetical protein [Erysipelotrichaceae bacterium]